MRMSGTMTTGIDNLGARRKELGITLARLSLLTGNAYTTCANRCDRPEEVALKDINPTLKLLGVGNVYTVINRGSK